MAMDGVTLNPLRLKKNTYSLARLFLGVTVDSHFVLQNRLFIFGRFNNVMNNHKTRFFIDFFCQLISLIIIVYINNTMYIRLKAVLYFEREKKIVKPTDK
jgi:hypothetical protein